MCQLLVDHKASIRAALPSKSSRLAISRDLSADVDHDVDVNTDLHKIELDELPKFLVILFDPLFIATALAATAAVAAAAAAAAAAATMRLPRR